jgi:Fe-S oxidoreductase
MAPSLLTAHRDGLLLCAACHDQCLSWTPELVASGDQALAVSRVAGALLRVESGADAWDAELADLVFHGLGDGLQEEVCIFRDAGQRIEPYRRAARAEALFQRLVPAGVLAIAERVRATGNVFGVARDWIGSEAAASSDAPIVVHDAATPALADGIDDACLRLVAAVGLPPGMARLASCGVIEYGLGLDTEARAAAEASARIIESLGRGPVVTADPALALMLRATYPVLGLDLGRPVLHAAEYLAERTDRLGPFRACPIRVVFHDPGLLARGLGVVEAPRRLLALVPDLELAEPATSGRLAVSDGPLVDIGLGETREIAQHRLDELTATRAAAIVTSSPHSLANLRALDPGIPVHDLFEFLDGLASREGAA